MARSVHHLRLPDSDFLTLCKREITPRYKLIEPSEVLGLEADGERICPVCRRRAENQGIIEYVVALADDGSVDYEACSRGDRQLESYLRRLGI